MENTIIWYLRAKKEYGPKVIRTFADQIMKFSAEDFTTALDLLAEEQGVGTTEAYNRLIHDASIGLHLRW